MKKDDGEETASVPLRDDYKNPRCIEEIKDEILYRKVEKPTRVAHAGEILKFC